MESPMSPGLEFLERCAGETGFQVPALEKVVRLGEVLAAVARHPLLGTSLTLKGGTALNLAFGQPTRLSVDLDFNYIASADRQAMLAARPGIESACVELGRRLGYGVQQSADEFAGRKLYLNFRSVLGPADQIEVDLNYLMRVPVGTPVERSLWQPGGLDRPTARLVNPMELAIGKLLALLDRSAARDVWDAANLPAELANVVLSPSFRQWFVGMAAILPNPLQTYTRARVEGRVSAATIEQHLTPMLVGRTSASTTDLVDRSWNILAPLLALSESELAYLDAFNSGELRADLLFGGDVESAARLSSHPAILWRLKNIREYLTRTRAERPG
jgi:predicted nucleotidyltransferase component of viral defense system